MRWEGQACAGLRPHRAAPAPSRPERARQEPFDAVGPAAHAARDGANFRRIIAARGAVGAAEAELREAVNAARDAGDPWALIAAALDMGTDELAAIEREARSIASRVSWTMALEGQAVTPSLVEDIVTALVACKVAARG